MKVFWSISCQVKPNRLKTFPIKVNNIPRTVNDILETYFGLHTTFMTELFSKTVNGFGSKLFFAKKFHQRCLGES